MNVRKFLQRVFSVLVITGLIFGIAAPATTVTARLIIPISNTTEPEVDPNLLEELHARGSTNFMIYFSEKPDLSAAPEMSWSDRGWFVMNALQAVADRSQARVSNHLDSQMVNYKSFWIDNIIVVEGGNLALLNSMLNFSEIVSIRSEPEVFLYEPEPAEALLPTLIVEPNLIQVNAPDVWGVGITGQGITVANIDTGVRYSHQALVNQYRGNLGGGSFDHNYNWWDPYQGTTVPNDYHDHGSHTIGTIVGDDGGANQIGMAPGAKWIACKSFQGGNITAQLLECGQFMAAPWNLSGANPDPDMRPHVVNNSWGDCQQTFDPWYDGVLTAWHASGIYPVFSNGNSTNCAYASPPGLNTVGNPARAGNVTGVGSTGRNNGQYATYSNWGPTDNPDTINPRGYPNLKPQVLAPGTNRSAGKYSDTHYLDMSGTSMAGPHVAGLVALMWQAAPCLIGDYAITETIIEETAIPIPYNTGGTPPPGPGNVPNYATGWGEIDALAAVEMALSMCGASTITGTVTAAGTGEPLASATVTVVGEEETRTLSTSADGTYSVAVSAGTYIVTAVKFGYLPQTVSGVAVGEDETVIVNLSLPLAPSATVSGYVKDAITAWPLHAKITIAGGPINPVYTDPVTGFYSVVVPQGMTFNFTATAWVGGYLSKVETLGPLSGNLNLDLFLDADVIACTAPGYSHIFVEYYSETFEDNDGSWINDSTHPWEWGTPVTWPSTCTEGTKCWGTNLNGNYDHSASFTLLSPVIDLSGAPGENLMAYWWQATHIESFTYDKGYAEVSINGGPWIEMWRNATSTQQLPWAERTFDISDAGGSTIQFRFRLTTDSSVNYAGYYVDRIRIAVPDCVVSTGGLVVGQAADANTGVPLPGTVVSNENGYTALAGGTEDPSVGDAFFTIFSPHGQKEFYATKSGGYVTVVEEVLVLPFTVAEHDFYLPAGYLVLEEDVLSVTVELGSTLEMDFTLFNEGGADLTFTVKEKDLGFTPVVLDGEEILVVRRDTTAADAVQATLTEMDVTFLGVTQAEFQSMTIDQLLGYEAVFFMGTTGTSGAPTANETKLIAFLDVGGSLFISDNDLGYFRKNYPFHDTYLQAEYQVDIAGDILIGEDIMAGLTLDVTPDPYPDGFTVRSEGVKIFQWQNSAHAGGVSIERMGYRAIFTSFDFHHLTNVPNRIALVERILDFLVAGDVPWLEFDPVEDAIAGSGTLTATVVFDASEVSEPGEYIAQLSFSTDTPYPKIVLPVTMTTTAPAEFGKLEGTVTSLGYCDIDPAPLNDAAVVVESGDGTIWTVFTNAEGKYTVWVDEAYSPFTITVTVENHPEGYAEDVEVEAGGITEVDFELRWLAPCLSVDPDAFVVEVQHGTSLTTVLTVTNEGAGEAEFEISDVDLGISEPASSASPASPLTTRRNSTHLSETGTPGESALLGPASGGPAPAEIGDTWELMAPLPAARVFNAVIADLNGYVYSMGGTSDAAGTTATNSNFRYDTTTNTWTTLAPIPVALDSITGVEINNKIYLPGDGNTAFTYVYDIASNTWANIPANGGYTARSQYQTVAIGTDLYVLGGIIGGLSSTTEVWKLDTLTESWSAGVPMQKSRTSFSAGAINGEIYVAGGVLFPGWIPDITAEKFDGTSWSYIADLPTGGGAYTRWSYNAAGVGKDGLWLGAGRRDAGWAVLNHAGYYHPDTNTWTDSPTIPMLSQGRVYMEGAVAIDGYFYVIGGRDSAGAVPYATNERLYVGYAGLSDATWITQDPITGTVEAENTFDIEITFIAEPEMTIGTTYLAKIRLSTNDPVRKIIELPVSMTVVEALWEVSVSPDMEGSQWPGETYTYPVEVKNMGNMSDTYLLTLNGGEWNASLDVDSVFLMPGQSTMVYVTVHVPPGAGPTERDMVVFRATSLKDNSIFADCQITTNSLATLPEHPELKVELTFAPTPIQVGQPKTFTALVSNIGNAAVHGVVASGEMPGAITFVEASDACTFANNVLTCDLGTIDAGASKTAWVTVIFMEAGTFDIMLGAAGVDVEPVTGTVTVTVVPLVEEPNRLFIPILMRSQ
jgi:uncharacterized repeat protein (TIGR01451 family)